MAERDIGVNSCRIRGYIGSGAPALGLFFIACSVQRAAYDGPRLGCGGELGLNWVCFFRSGGGVNWGKSFG